MSANKETRLRAMGIARPSVRGRADDARMGRSFRRMCGGAFGRLSGTDRWADYAYRQSGKTANRKARAIDRARSEARAD